jgi:hypothetical protein
LHFDEIFSLAVLSTQTSMNDLEASLLESLEGSPATDCPVYDDSSRRFSLDSEPENAIAANNKQNTNSQEPTPTEKPEFEIGEA